MAPRQTSEKVPVDRSQSPPAVDDLDRAIIEQLQEDGRRTYTRIGQSVGLSEAAVRQRVQRMTDSGAMQVVAVTDPMALGFKRMGMIGVRTEGDVTTLAETLGSWPEVSYVVLTAGSFDVMVEVVVADDSALLNLLNNKLRKLPGVRSTETFVYLRLYKQAFTWGAK